MPVRYVIDKERRLVLTTGEGHVTIQEFHAHANQLRKDPDFDPRFNQLNDYTAGTDAVFSGDQLADFARQNLFSPESRRAIVVSKTHHYGIARQFEAYQEGRSIVRVFYNRDEALKWLGVKEDAGLF